MTCPGCGRWSPADRETGYDADEYCPSCKQLEDKMDVKIIGQAEVHDYSVTLLVECPCHHKFVLTGPVGTMRKCGGITAEGKPCTREYLMSGLPIEFNGETYMAPLLVQVTLTGQNILAPLGQRG